MGPKERIPAAPEQVMEAFTDALTASERLRDTFTRMGETDLASVADRNVGSITSARDQFLSVFEPRELRRPVDLTAPDEVIGL